MQLSAGTGTLRSLAPLKLVFRDAGKREDRLRQKPHMILQPRAGGGERLGLPGEAVGAVLGQLALAEAVQRERHLGRDGLRHRDERRCRSPGPLGSRGEARTEGRRILQRHGSPKAIPPHRINYRANIWALKSLDRFQFKPAPTAFRPGSSVRS